MSDTTVRQGRLFDECQRLTSEKNARYNDAWRHQGWRGNLSRVLEKSERLRNMLWRPGVDVMTVGGSEHPRETILDMINTLSFMAMNMDEGREWGHEEPYPNHGKAPDSFEPSEFGYRSHDPHTQYRPSVGEATLSHGELPPVTVPGSEQALTEDSPPSPQPRGQGSGPRRVQERKTSGKR